MRIVEYPHPALRHPAVPVTHIDKRLHLHIGRMVELLHEAEGLGLAAPQVALPYQLLIMNLGEYAPGEDPDQVFLNPRIVERKGSMAGQEGCLSFPGLFAKVIRAREVVIEAFNLKGEKVTIKARDMASRCWQHEIDHLQGKLFIERFSTVANIACHRDLVRFERKLRKAQEAGEIASDADIEKLLHSLEQEMKRS